MSKPRGSQRGLPLAVVDNTLLSRLVHLGVAEFLPLLFDVILIPPEVRREAYRTRHGGRRQLRNLIREMSDFFIDCQEANPDVKNLLKADLHEGEAAAIAQADFKHSILLLDEQKGFKRATRMQLEVIRTGRLLNLLKKAGAIRTVRPYIEKLDHLGFYMTIETKNRILADAEEPEFS